MDDFVPADGVSMHCVGIGVASVDVVVFVYAGKVQFYCRRLSDWTLLSYPSRCLDCTWTHLLTGYLSGWKWALELPPSLPALSRLHTHKNTHSVPGRISISFPNCPGGLQDLGIPLTQHLEFSCSPVSGHDRLTTPYVPTAATPLRGNALTLVPPLQAQRDEPWHRDR